MTAEADDAAIAPVLAIWRRVLERPDLGPDDDFGRAGGEYARALMVTESMQTELGIETTADEILEAGTVRRLVATVAAPTAEAGLSSVLRRGRPDQIPLVLMPPGGGNSLAYERLADAMACDRAMYALRTPGADGLEPPATSIEQLASRFLPDVVPLARDQTVHLVGWSTGGLMAYEVAVELLEAGLDVGRVVMIDTLFPGKRVRFRDVTRRDRLSDMVRHPTVETLRTQIIPSVKKRIVRARRAAQWAVRSRTGKPLDPRLVERWQIDAAFAAAQTYRPRRAPVPLVYIAAGRSEPDLTTDPWSEFVDDIELAWVEGTHAGDESVMGAERVGQVADLLNARLP